MQVYSIEHWLFFIKQNLGYLYPRKQRLVNVSIRRLPFRGRLVCCSLGDEIQSGGVVNTYQPVAFQVLVRVLRKYSVKQEAPKLLCFAANQLILIG